MRDIARSLGLAGHRVAEWIEEVARRALLVDGGENAAEVVRMKMGGAIARPIDLVDHANAQARNPGAFGLRVGHLQDQHVSGVASASGQEARGGRVGAHRLEDLDEGGAGGDHRIAQAIVNDVRVPEGDLQPEHGRQTIGHGVEISGRERDLPQAHLEPLGSDHGNLV